MIDIIFKNTGIFLVLQKVFFEKLCYYLLDEKPELYIVFSQTPLVYSLPGSLYSRKKGAVERPGVTSFSISLLNHYNPILLSTETRYLQIKQISQTEH